MKKILITGGTGFIGQNLCEYLSPRYQIFAPSHKELDLTDSEKVENYISLKKIQVIINAAVTDEFETNLRMFFNIARCENFVEKIIHFGSGAEYDKTSEIGLIRESEFGKRIPAESYGFYKYICSRNILRSKNIVCLRLFGVYGKYEDYLFKFISNAIVKNLLHMDIIIGQNVFFDYLYINDLVRIVEYFIGHRTNDKDFNAVTGERVDLKSIVQIINSISDFQSKIIIMNKGLNKEYTANNARLKKEIRGLSYTPLEKGIRELYMWYKDRLTSIDKQSVRRDAYLSQLTINK